MNQEELIKQLKPVGFKPDIHIIIKASFKGNCQICNRGYYTGEFITYNPEKKKGRHMNCNDPKIKARSKRQWGPRNVKK